MGEAIYCRVKCALLLMLFAAPVVVAYWNQKLDRQIDDSRYLPALTRSEFHFEDQPTETMAEDSPAVCLPTSTDDVYTSADVDELTLP